MVWREPVRGGFDVHALGLSGIERVRALGAADAMLPPIRRLTGIRVTRVGPGAVTCSMPASTLMLDSYRWLDVFILSELTATLTATTAVEPGTDVRCAAMSIHHQRVATMDVGALLARGALIHAGRTHTLAEVTVEDAQGRPITRAFASIVPAEPSTGGDEVSVEPIWPTPDPWMREHDLQPRPGPDTTLEEEVELVRDGTLTLGPSLHELGAQIVDIGPGRATLTLPASEWLSDRPDRLNAGAIVSLTAWTLGYATGTLATAGKRIAVIEHHAQLLRSVRPDGERLACHARVTHDVEDFWVTAADVIDAAGNIVATAGFTSITAPVYHRTVAAPVSERVLATILFSDIVGSTEQAQRLGDQNWQRQLARHHAIVRREIGLYKGREIKTTGDGFVVLFDAPARAVQCATAIRRSLHEVGIQVRIGLHTGECEVSEGDVSGIAVHAAARIESTADAGEILVSQTVRDLTAGSGLVYDDAGEHELKGIDSPWRLFTVPTATSLSGTTT